jgi:K+-transporting ATPase A subunit
VVTVLIVVVVVDDIYSVVVAVVVVVVVVVVVIVVVVVSVPLARLSIKTKSMGVNSKANMRYRRKHLHVRAEKLFTSITTFWLRLY